MRGHVSVFEIKSIWFFDTYLYYCRNSCCCVIAIIIVASSQKLWLRWLSKVYFLGSPWSLLVPISSGLVLISLFNSVKLRKWPPDSEWYASHYLFGRLVARVANFEANVQWLHSQRNLLKEHSLKVNSRLRCELLWIHVDALLSSCALVVCWLAHDYSAGPPSCSTG